MASNAPFDATSLLSARRRFACSSCGIGLRPCSARRRGGSKRGALLRLTRQLPTVFRRATSRGAISASRVRTRDRDGPGLFLSSPRRPAAQSWRLGFARCRFPLPAPVSRSLRDAAMEGYDAVCVGPVRRRYGFGIEPTTRPLSLPSPPPLPSPSPHARLASRRGRPFPPWRGATCPASYNRCRARTRLARIQRVCPLSPFSRSGLFRLASLHVPPDVGA